MNRISKREDFPNVSVFERREKDGRQVYRVEFGNRTFYGEKTGLFIVFGTVGLIALAFAVGGPDKGFPALLLVVLVLVLLAIRGPYKKERVAIEVEPESLRVRVFRNNRLALARAPLSNLTVEPHSGAAFAAEDRRGRREKHPRQKEMTHCLVGWFGAGGAARVVLVERVEWPVENSLFEVRQALLWALAQDRAGTGPFVPAGEADDVPVGGLNPPLD